MRDRKRKREPKRKRKTCTRTWNDKNKFEECKKEKNWNILCGCFIVPLLHLCYFSSSSSSPYKCVLACLHAYVIFVLVHTFSTQVQWLCKLNYENMYTNFHYIRTIAHFLIVDSYISFFLFSGLPSHSLFYVVFLFIVLNSFDYITHSFSFCLRSQNARCNSEKCFVCNWKCYLLKQTVCYVYLLLNHCCHFILLDRLFSLDLFFSFF